MKSPSIENLCSFPSSTSMSILMETLGYGEETSEGLELQTHCFVPCKIEHWNVMVGSAKNLPSTIRHPDWVDGQTPTTTSA